MAFASPSAFRARTLARSRPSGLDKNPALAQRLVQHRALEVTPFFGMSGANDDHVKRHIEPAKLPAQTRRLGAAFRHLIGLDYEQVEVRVRTSLPSGTGAEEDYLCSRRGRGEAASRLFNQGLIGHRHPKMLVAMDDGSQLSSSRRAWSITWDCSSAYSETNNPRPHPRMS